MVIGLLVFNAIFNNMSVISQWSVVLHVEESQRKQTYLPQVTETLSHKVVSSTPFHRGGRTQFRLW